MNGEAQVLRSNPPTTDRKAEQESALERKTAARGEASAVLTTGDSSKNENRFVRLKRNLRKRSASIL